MTQAAVATQDRPRVSIADLDARIRGVAQESAEKGASIALKGYQDLQAETTRKAKEESPSPLLAQLAQHFATHPAPDEGALLDLSPDGSFQMISREQVAQEVEMGQASFAGAVQQLDGLGGLKMPFGSVLIGGLPGAVVGTAIDRVVPRVGGVVNTNIIVKGAVGYVGARFLPKYIGGKAAGYFVGGLVLQILADVLPVQAAVDWLTNSLLRLMPGRASAGLHGAVAQAEAHLSQVGPRSSVNDRVWG